MKILLLLLLATVLPGALAASLSHVTVTSNTFTDDGTGTPVTVVSVGDSVAWRNVQGVHTVSSVDGVTMRSTSFGPGETYMATFLSPGAFPYRCGFHSAMNGLVLVKA